jgi:MFS family permease
MVAGALLVAQFGIQTTSLLFAVLVLPAWVLIYRYIPQASQSDTQVTYASLEVKTSLWKKSSVLVTLLSGLLLALAYQGVFTSTLSRLIELRQPFTVIGGVVIGAAVMASIFQGARWGWEPWAAPWFGRLSDSYGRKRILVGTMGVAAFLFALLHAPVSFAWWVIMLLGIQMTATILTTLMDTWAADEASRQPNSTAMMTMYSVVTDVGAALGPLLAYWMAESYGLDWMYGGIALILLLMALIWLRVRETTEIRSDNTL